MAVKVWGVTGFAGSGKSSAIEYLAERGYPVCDADELAQEVLDPSEIEGQTNLTQLRNLLGPKVLTTEGGPNRPFLRDVITENGDRRKILEKFMFPLLINRFQKLRREWDTEGYLMGFLEGSRLVESGYVSELSGLVVVTASPELRKARLMENRGMTSKEVDALMSAQDQKMAENQAKFVWSNSGTPETLHKQIDIFLMVSDPNSTNPK
jgi:dephospho-CoA kinase